MTRHLVQNFRGVNALVIHGQDRNRAVLTETLTKLGLKVRVADPFAVRAALPHIAIEAPQGEVHVDRDNRHCHLTPRIGVSNASGGFDIIYEAARPVRPDPYLVWQELKSPSGMRPPSLRVVK